VNWAINFFFELTPPNAADFISAPPTTDFAGRRAAAADQKHPARRRRSNCVGAGLYPGVIHKKEL
jgi:hypothetical protein